MPVAFVTCLSREYEQPKQLNADVEIAIQVIMDVAVNDGDFEWRKSGT
jgi:hypothetical protein